VKQYRKKHDQIVRTSDIRRAYTEGGETRTHLVPQAVGARQRLTGRLHTWRIRAAVARQLSALAARVTAHTVRRRVAQGVMHAWRLRCQAAKCQVGRLRGCEGGVGFVRV
jgi:hypothetical protein